MNIVIYLKLVYMRRIINIGQEDDFRFQEMFIEEFSASKIDRAKRAGHVFPVGNRSNIFP